MAEVIKGRQTADLTDEVVVFLIGMRINRLFRPWTWLPVFRAMPSMLGELYQDPSLGFISARTYWSGRVIMVVEYWRSFEELESYARAPDRAHLPAWGEFNQKVKASGAVGIFHETYRVGPGRVETIYRNMPPFGLGGAIGQVPVAVRGQSAARRMNGTAEDQPAVEPY